MIHTLKSLLWGLPTVSIVLLFGLYFTVRSRAYNIRKLFSILKNAVCELRSDIGGIGVSASMATALGGTIGIGSISGVAVSLASGGPGSIFWMWCAGFLGCMLKYAETNVALRYRVRDGDICSGGAMYALKACGKPLAGGIFAVSALLASFGTGNMTQSSAVSVTLAQSGIPVTLTGTLLAFLFLLSVSGGRKTIAKISEKTVPAAGGIYLLIVTAMIAAKADRLPSVICDIVSSAFGFRQACGGVAGFTVSAAVRTGVTRCVFSSEMGMGSSPIVHASNENATPHSQGSWGIIEMMTDVFVFSSLTAFALLLHGKTDAEGLFSSVLGKAGTAILPALLAVFGFASIISWCFYAESCMSYLGFGKAARSIYRVLSACFVFLGSVIGADKVWDISDILNVFMMIPNLYLLFIKRKEICLCFGKTKQ